MNGSFEEMDVTGIESPTIRVVEEKRGRGEEACLVLVGAVVGEW